jgi:hypothetical protein
MGVIFSLVLAVTSSVSQPVEIDRKMPCDRANAVMKNLYESYKELPVWVGKNEDGGVSVLTINSTTKTWTMLIVHKSVACIADSGEGFESSLNKQL